MIPTVQSQQTQVEDQQYSKHQQYYLNNHSINQQPQSHNGSSLQAFSSIVLLDKKQTSASSCVSMMSGTEAMLTTKSTFQELSSSDLSDNSPSIYASRVLSPQSVMKQRSSGSEKSKGRKKVSFLIPSDQGPLMIYSQVSVPQANSRKESSDSSSCTCSPQVKPIIVSSQKAEMSPASTITSVSMSEFDEDMEKELITAQATRAETKKIERKNSLISKTRKLIFDSADYFLEEDKKRKEVQQNLSQNTQKSFSQSLPMSKMSQVPRGENEDGNKSSESEEHDNKEHMTSNRICTLSNKHNNDNIEQQNAGIPVTISHETEKQQTCNHQSTGNKRENRGQFENCPTQSNVFFAVIPESEPANQSPASEITGSSESSVSDSDNSEEFNDEQGSASDVVTINDETNAHYYVAADIRGNLLSTHSVLETKQLSQNTTDSAKDSLNANSNDKTPIDSESQYKLRSLSQGGWGEASYSQQWKKRGSLLGQKKKKEFDSADYFMNGNNNN